jgi:hypothetical protein
VADRRQTFAPNQVTTAGHRTAMQDQPNPMPEPAEPAQVLVSDQYAGKSTDASTRTLTSAPRDTLPNVVWPTIKGKSHFGGPNRSWPSRTASDQ